MKIIKRLQKGDWVYFAGDDYIVKKIYKTRVQVIRRGRNQLCWIFLKDLHFGAWDADNVVYKRSK